MSKNLIKSTAVFSSITLLSRVLGLVRDVVIANLVGASAIADVFYFAQKIPNFLRRLFAEGAFSQAFVPVLAEYTGDLTDMQKFIAKVSGTLGILVTIVTLIGIIASPIITALFGTGWFLSWLSDGADAEKFVQASFLLKITFPYLWFITFVALSGAILNTIGKFGVMSFSPVFLNVAIIFAAIYIAPRMQNPNTGLAIGIFLGGLLQFLFQIPFLWREKLLVKPKWAWNDPGVVKIRTLMIPALFGVSVNQINLLLDTFIASFLVTGSISWLYYSERLLEFPLGLFGIAISTVILPALSKYNVVNNNEINVDNSNYNLNQYTKTMDWGVRMILFLGIPSSFAIITLAKPILMILFMRGSFTVESVEFASYSLMAMCCGLVFFMLVKVFASGYYAKQDTKTPVRYGIIAMVSNMCFNLLAIVYGYLGLAIASVMSGILNASLLYNGLHKRRIYQFSYKSIIFVVQLLIAATMMTIGIVYYNPSFQDWLLMTISQRLITLFCLIGLAIFIYIITLIAVGVRKHHFIVN